MQFIMIRNSIQTQRLLIQIDLNRKKFRRDIPNHFYRKVFLVSYVGFRVHSLLLRRFGDGPRNCIGLRFGMMQARIGLVTLIRNFEFTPCSKSIIPLVFSKRSVVLSPEGGLWLNVKKLQQ